VVSFTSPNYFDRISNGDALTLSWSCTPVAQDSASLRVSDAPKLILSILNEIIQTEVRFFNCVAPFSVCS
jgi:hypothetical protein